MGSGPHAATSPVVGRPSAAFWALPLVVVVEFVGSTYRIPLLFSSAFFGALVLLFRGRLAQPQQHHRAAPGAGPRTMHRFRHQLELLAWPVGLVGLGLLAGLLPPLFGGEPGLSSKREDIGLLLALAGCWLVTASLAWVRGRAPVWQDLERCGLLVAFAFVMLLSAGHRVQGLAVFPDEPWALASMAVTLLALLACAGRWHWQRLGMLLFAGCVLRGYGLGVWQPDPAVRDMLPLIQAAGEALVQGQSPYSEYQMQPGSVVPLTYLPGLWLLHNLPTYVGLPLRLTSLVADLAIVAALWWTAGQSPARRSAALGLAAVWLFSPSVQWNAIYAEPHPWWGLLALTLAAGLRRSWRFSAVCLGLAIASRQFAWVLAPFWLIWVIKQRGWVAGAHSLFLAGAVSSALLLPFVLWAPEDFWFGTLRWFLEYGVHHKSWFLERLGFAGTFYRLGWERWLMPVAAVGVVLALVVAWRARTRQGLLGAAFLGYAWAVMLSPVLWDSFYLGVFVFGSLVALDQSGQAAAFTAQPPARASDRTRWWWAVAAAQGAALIWLVYSFWITGSEAGLTAAATQLAERTRSEDVVLDHSRRRLAFVQPPLALPAHPARAVVADPFAPELPEMGWLAAPRLGLLARSAVDADLVKRVEKLGTTVERGQHGAFDWLIVKRDPVLATLSAGLVAGSFRGLDASVSALATQADGRLTSTRAQNVDVRVRECSLGGRSRRMLFAHPDQRGTLLLSFDKPAAATRLALVAGFDDGAVRWGRADVLLRLPLSHAGTATFRVRNLPGPEFRVFQVAGAGSNQRITIEIETTDDRQRWLCLEGLWL